MRKMFLLSGLLLSACAATEPVVPGAPVSLSSRQIEVVQAGVMNQLRDPESAQFSNIAATVAPTGIATVCGKVNAKNGFGGYAGSRAFVGFLRGESFTLDWIDNNDIVTIYGPVGSTCHAAGVPI